MWVWEFGSYEMVPRITSPIVNYSDLPTENLTTRFSDKKGCIPKKIHKVEREKLKRDHLNELFQEIGLTLERTQQNRGKASVLSDATKLMHDLICQVESLRRENTALQNESRYVAVERDELKDENVTLRAELEKLQMEIWKRMQFNHLWTNSALTPPSLAQPVVHTIPIQHDQPYAELSDLANAVPEPVVHVSRPHARHPALADSWQYEILSQHPVFGTDGGTVATGDGGVDFPASPKELQLLI